MTPLKYLNHAYELIKKEGSVNRQFLIAYVANRIDPAQAFRKREYKKKYKRKKYDKFSYQKNISLERAIQIGQRMLAYQSIIAALKNGSLIITAENKIDMSEKIKIRMNR